MSRYRTVIGLEIHVQLSTKTKMFCSCSAGSFDAEPNTNICPVCTGQPGVLPVTNEQAVEYAVKTSLALNFEVHEYSRFDRKNYFYPDLPKGYQITQYFYPIATNGWIEIEDENGNKKKIRLRRLHMEEDAGKLIHAGDSMKGESLVDYNRAGVPLVEIVTEPDISSPEEARLFLEKLRSIVRYLGVSSGDMEKGALRCDANISVVDEETGKSSNRVEIKNINSFKFVEKALEYEEKRIREALEKGENVPQETRGWNMKEKKTISMRSKEEENDYRYFPEPDLPPLVLSKEYIERIKQSLPELPDQKKERFMKEYNLPRYDATVLTSDKDLASFFEEAAKLTGKPKEVSNYIMSQVLRYMNENKIESIYDTKIAPEHFKELFDLIDSGKITTNIAKNLIRDILKTGKSPKEIVKEKGLEVETDESKIGEIIKKAMKQNPDAVQQYKNGKKSVIGFFIGAVMKETRGKADPKIVQKIATKLLDEN
ncbi:MAG: Asp-tRNA(Asn)/Glu-tRNA(Gln) amidotransferase subunit GatB [Thermotogaceae bacterium]|nr:Asp-tRNA(Asn)/Glu-tRNA(Gln) amidotransferase subunit GatB [Thermotogaceae bacterium]